MLMRDVKDEFQTCVNAFVNDLRDLVREATLGEIIEAVKNADGHAPAHRVSLPAELAKDREERNVGLRKPGRPRSALVAAPKAGQRRAPELVAQFTQGVHSYITAHPGAAVAPIAASLGTSTRELSLVLRKLLDENKITSKGKKRGTRYFPK